MKPHRLLHYLPFTLLGVLVLVLAIATVVDRDMPTTAPVIYGSGWFVALWAVVAAAACVHMYRQRLWHRPRVVCLHMALLVILLGALVTHIGGERGFVHLRQGEVTHQYMQRDANQGIITLHDMPFLMALDTFRVHYDADGVTPADYVSHVTTIDRQGHRQHRISMNRIARLHGYRIFQTSYDEDFHGSLFTVNHDPWGTGITYAGYLLLAIAMILGSSLGEGRPRWHLPDAREAISWVLGLLLASYMVISIAFRPLVPVLRSPLLVVHVGVIMASYVLLVVSFVRRQVLRTAVFLLAAGIFLGAIWANISWGSYWSWDPKETWAIITLIVYSIPLHQQSLPWFRSTGHYRIYSALCLLCLLMTYFGVNYLLGGMHSYSN